MNGSSHPKHEKSLIKNVLARILALLMGAARPKERRAMVRPRMRLCPIWRACGALKQNISREIFMKNRIEAAAGAPPRGRRQ
jgi:hypothetical protein